MKTLLFIVASLREESVNKRLANVVARELPEGYAASFFDIGTLPLYNADHDGANAPESVLRLREAITAADGLFIFSPEYNYSLPGVLKNAIDWASRPMLPQSCIVAKPMNAIVATMSPTNGTRALVEIKRLWGILGGVPVPAFDFVLHAAGTRFETVDGEETLDAAALKAVRLQITYLQNLVESDASAIAQKTFSTFADSLKA